MAIQEARGAPTTQRAVGRSGGFRATLGHLLGKDWGIAYVFMLPLTLLIFGLVGFPIVKAVYLTLFNQVGIRAPVWVGLQNYKDLYADGQFRDAVQLTVKFAVVSVFVKFWVGIVAALLVHNIKRFRSVITGLILLPWIVPEVVAALTWRGLYQPGFGGINALLRWSGVINHELPFVSDIHWALPSVIAVNVWKGIPFFTLTLLSGLKSIDAELYDAAAVDGANAWQRFLNITLPGLRYVIIVACLLSLIFTLNAFGLVFVMTGGGPLNATRLFSIFAYELFGQQRYSRATTVAMSIVPVLLLLIIILGRYMRGDPSRVAAAETTWSKIGNWVLQAICLVVGGALLAVSVSPTWLLALVPILLVASFVTIGDRSLLSRNEVADAWVRWFCLLVGIGGLSVIVFNLRFFLVAVVLLAIVRSEILDALFARFRRTSAGAPRSQASIQITNYLGRGAMYLALALLLFFELFPFYWVFVTSFKSQLQIQALRSIFWPDPWTLENFHYMLVDTKFLLWFWNTTRVALVSCLISIVVGALGAYALVRLKWRGAGAMSTVILFTYLMPTIMIIIPLYQILTNLHLINTLGALMIAYPTFGLPFACWLLMGYYRSIPVELEEAALIDGCNHFQAFFRVILPLIMPALVTVALFALTAAFNDFLLAYILVRPEEYTTVAVGVAKMVIGDIFPYGRMMAASIMMAVPVAIVYMIAQRFLVEGLTAGSVKG